MQNAKFSLSCYNLFGKLNIPRKLFCLERKRKGKMTLLQTGRNHGEIADQRGHRPRHLSHTQDIDQPLRELQHREHWTEIS